MPNFNDAEITAVYVSHKASPRVQDDAPTSGDPFDVTLEIVAGNALYTGAYTLTVSCADLTAWKPAPASGGGDQLPVMLGPMAPTEAICAKFAATRTGLPA